MKKKVTLTIDKILYEEFIKITNKFGINKSKFIENYIKNYINETKNS